LVTVTARDGRVVETGQPVETPALGGPNLWLAPGLVDIQVNGYAGYDVNSPEVTPDDIAALVRVLWRVGVTHFCPTVTTGSFERMSGSCTAIATACDADPTVAHAVLGIHVEGPYIAPEDGPRGAHPRAQIRPPSYSEFRRLQDAADGRIALLTLAPEQPGALDLIERLTAESIVVALGHHAANAEQISAAVHAGARLCTHLGNGAHAVLPRHPNYLWDQLAEDALWASIIVDGHHLPPSVVRCFVRSKGLERLILVSDTVAPGGLPPGRYIQMDREVELSPDGRLSMVGTPYLAGAARPLVDGVANLRRFAEVSLADAVEAASHRPASLFGASNRVGDLLVGAPAELVLLSESSNSLAVAATMTRGHIVYSAV
ncbi:MAG: amidohydrolase family protein, partial [Chloroflexi bacterium]|nr:amidohydrolase family protein [Chloroflexota bacterium]